jgi:hypothetical protein
LAQSGLPDVLVEGRLEDFLDDGAGAVTEPSIAYVGGCTIGNLIHPIADEFPMPLLISTIGTLHSYARCGWLLLTFDTTTDEAQLHQRYGGLNREFMRNIMRRAADEFPDSGLNPDLFVHTPEYRSSSRQYAHILTATAEQSCAFGVIARGRRFHIVNSYKIDPKWLDDAARANKCRVVYTAVDDATGAGLMLLRSVVA